MAFRKQFDVLFNSGKDRAREAFFCNFVAEIEQRVCFARGLTVLTDLYSCSTHLVPQFYQQRIPSVVTITEQDADIGRYQLILKLEERPIAASRVIDVAELVRDFGGCQNIPTILHVPRRKQRERIQHGIILVTRVTLVDSTP